MLAILAVLLKVWGDPSPDEQGLEILAQAATAQRGEVALPLPGTLHGLFSVTLRKQDGSGTFEVEIERHYMRSPERMLTRRTDSVTHSDSSVGFDGDVFWMQDNRTGERLIYSDDPETFGTDLALEQQQLMLTRLILEVVSVDGLLEQLIAPRFLGRQTINVPSRRRHGDDREVDVVGAQLVDVIFEPDLSAPPPPPGSPPPLLDIRLFIDVDSHYVHRVELSTRGRAQRQMWQLVLSRHAANSENLIVPSTIRVLDTNGDEFATLGIIPDAEGLPVFALGQPMATELFALPPESADDDEG